MGFCRVIRQSLYAGETLANKLVGLTDTEIFIAAYEDCRISNKEISRVSGYSYFYVLRLYKKAKLGGIATYLVKILAEASIKCALKVYGSSLKYTEENLNTSFRSCKTGLCDEEMVVAQNLLLSSRKSGVKMRDLAKACGRTRQWLYNQRQRAMYECQDDLTCDNWRAIINAANKSS